MQVTDTVVHLLDALHRRDLFLAYEAGTYHVEDRSGDTLYSAHSLVEVGGWIDETQAA